jgi:hypothetical protein
VEVVEVLALLEDPVLRERERGDEGQEVIVPVVSPEAEVEDVVIVIDHPVGLLVDPGERPGSRGVPERGEDDVVRRVGEHVRTAPLVSEAVVAGLDAACREVIGLDGLGHERRRNRSDRTREHHRPQGSTDRSAHTPSLVKSLLIRSSNTGGIVRDPYGSAKNGFREVEVRL